MWHEARKREKATQKLFNDHKKRAEKRREENRVDPSSFLQVNGVKAKLNLDANIYKQAATSMVAWQGDPKIMIDRFDVRATLASIPKGTTSDKSSKDKNRTVLDVDESKPMKTLLDYERYRLLIQNDLHGVGEGSRLKLVAQSDIISDAKLRKLEGNKFGTSGESRTNEYNNQYRGNSNLIREATNKRINSTGPTYNSVPPPSSLSSSQSSSQASSRLTSWRSEQQSQVSSSDVPSLASQIIDLDDYDNYDPDSVNVREESKQTSDIAKKYGLSSEELILLSKLDTREATLKESLQELKKVAKQTSQISSQQQVYGPALPSNLIASHTRVPISTSESDDDDTHVPQRSPTGASMIPLREECRNSNDDQSDEDTETPRSKPIVRPTTPPQVPTSPAQPEPVALQPAEREPPKEQQNSPSPDVETRRRASTPLAYKRNRRSSRSVSRERRKNDSTSNDRHHRRRRRRSSSISSSSSSDDRSRRRRSEHRSRKRVR